MKVCPFWFHCCRLLSYFLLKIFHSIRSQGGASLPPGPLILAPNHASYFDPPAAGSCIPRVTYYLARHTLFAPPIGSWLLPSVGSIPVNQESPGPSSLKRIFEVLKGGGTLVLFPEGGRTLDGNIARAEPGIGMIAARANVPVVPVHIIGSREALARGGSWHPFRPIWVVYGKPMHFSGNPKSREDFQKFADEIMTAIGQLTFLKK
ncbi:MAG: lysophospholipid acyltransferase family protein [Verrucomicrobia bacterium]|nr:lysophospholipid acyltransferase family protein [Verrucomicrobiota bacterium]